MLKLFVLALCVYPQDSIVKDTTISIMFKPSKTQEQLDKIVYRHSQGFFCDFEDRINKNRKLNLNVGVGDQ
jgi:hypothetical protein